ncbi:MAG: alpha/beta fold hydrolase [Pseudomonadota bacterium]
MLDEFLTLGDGTRLHYCHRSPAANSGQPTVLFCPGFRSISTGIKGQFLAKMTAAEGLGFASLDYRGHGTSSGRIQDGTVGAWLLDLLNVIDRVTKGPLILVGSSMGGWLAVLAARDRPERVMGLIGVAAAPDFTEDLLAAKMDEAAQAAMALDGIWYRPSDYDDEPDPISKSLIDEGRKHMVLRSPVEIIAPVRLLHGVADPDVPWQQSERLMRALAGGDVRLTLIKDGDHRLSRPEDLALLADAVRELAARGR